jgi:alpha-glucan, water dikinase
MRKYWDHLHANGINKDRLASYERKITEEPYIVAGSIGDFENYLTILKEMHSSDDLNMMIQQARHHVGGDTHSLMNEVQKNFNDHDKLRQIDRILALRQNLCNNHMDRNNTQKLKDVIFLDLCLE